MKLRNKFVLSSLIAAVAAAPFAYADHVIVVGGGGPGGHADPDPTPVIVVPGGGPGGSTYDPSPGYYDPDPTPIYDGGYSGGGYYDGGGYSGGGDVYVACAPEVAASNLATTDQVLSNLSANELKGSQTFKDKVAAVAAMPAGKAKTDAYFGLIGVNAGASASEVLNVLYARQIDAKYVQAVSANLGLNADQSKLVIERLASALRPR